MITVFAPSGIGEVAPGDDLASAILAAVADDPAGPLAEGDVLVVTSKIISKQEGRFVPATELAAAKESETVRTVARRGSVGIVQSRLGIIQAAAGVDNSNVDPTQALVLPEDPDASAEALRAELVARTGLPLGVLISDTAGRAWRVGQTDHAIGAAGVRVLDSYAGRTDAYGNDLKVTEVAVADELAAAADLVKSKLSGRPVAVVRGLPGLVVDPAGDDDSPVRADVLLRDPAEDLFALGSREAVLAAVLHAIDRSAQFEELVALEDSTILEERVLSDLDPDLSGRELLRRVLRAAGSLPMPDGPA